MVSLQRKALLVFFDAIIINIVLFLTAFLRYGADFLDRSMGYAWVISLISTIACISIYSLFNLYKSLWRYAGIDELLNVVLASLVSSAALSLFYGAVSGQWPMDAFFTFFSLSAIFVASSRIFYRLLRRLKQIKKRLTLEDGKRAMIIGAGQAGAMVIAELKRHPEMGIKPVAVIDDDKVKYKTKLMGVTVHGTRNSIVEVVEKLQIDEIIIAIPSAPRCEIKEILKECKKTKCRLRTLPGIYELINGKVSIKQLRDVEIEDLLGREPIHTDMDKICGYIKGQTVLVTGAGGSIGSELCRQIARYNPRKLLMLDIYENGVYDLEQELVRAHPELEYEVLIASVRDRARLESIFCIYRPTVVFHAAAHKHVPLMEHNPGEAIKNNVFGTLNVAECADKYNTRRFVLISTDKAVNPTNIMGATKRIAEMIIQGINKVSATEYVAVRFGNVLGSNGSVIPLFKQQIAEGGPVTVTHPDINRFFMTIPEAVELVLQAGSMANGGEIFILDMGQPVRIDDLARDLIRLSGLEPDVDIKIEYTGLRPGEKLCEELMMEEEGLTSTRHKKIFIGKPSDIDIASMRRDLEKLKFLQSGSSEAIRDFIKTIVPTYIYPDISSSAEAAAADKVD
jgi:FlaA1/EpsC-like NDP-sugar epimerase